MTTNRMRPAILTLVLGTSLALSGQASASCSHSTRVHNDSSIVLRIVKLKSAVDGIGIFKKQWTGEKVIQPGSSKTINWTSDFSCTNNGVARQWDVKLYRKNDDRHFCGDLSQSESVTIDTPNLCFG